MEWFLLWLFMISEKLAGGLQFLGVASCMVFIAHFFFNLINENGTEGWKALKKTLVFGVVCMALATMIPVKKDIALIVAGGVSYNVLTSDAAKEVGGKSLKILTEKLDSYINEVDVKEVVTGAVSGAVKSGVETAKETPKETVK